jgi:hypothetical protein
MSEFIPGERSAGCVDVGGGIEPERSGEALSGQGDEAPHDRAIDQVGDQHERGG